MDGWLDGRTDGWKHAILVAASCLVRCPERPLSSPHPQPHPNPNPNPQPLQNNQRHWDVCVGTSSLMDSHAHSNQLAPHHLTQPQLAAVIVGAFIGLAAIALTILATVHRRRLSAWWHRTGSDLLIHPLKLHMRAPSSNPTSGEHHLNGLHHDSLGGSGGLGMYHAINAAAGNGHAHGNGHYGTTGGIGFGGRRRASPDGWRSALQRSAFSAPNVDYSMPAAGPQQWELVGSYPRSSLGSMGAGSGGALVQRSGSSKTMGLAAAVAAASAAAVVANGSGNGHHHYPQQQQQQQQQQAVSAAAPEPPPAAVVSGSGSSVSSQRLGSEAAAAEPPRLIRALMQIVIAAGAGSKDSRCGGLCVGAPARFACILCLPLALQCGSSVAPVRCSLACVGPPGSTSQHPTTPPTSPPPPIHPQPQGGGGAPLAGAHRHQRRRQAAGHPCFSRAWGGAQCRHAGGWMDGLGGWMDVWMVFFGGVDTVMSTQQSQIGEKHIKPTHPPIHPPAHPSAHLQVILPGDPARTDMDLGMSLGGDLTFPMYSFIGAGAFAQVGGA